jgi:hypothetical protein
MSLNEALKHINSILNAGSVSAQVALKEKIGAGEIPVKWADSEPPRDTPDIRELAVSQLILLEPGFASDGWSYRPLLMLRSAVHSAWPSGKSRSSPLIKGPQSIPSQVAPWATLVEAVDHIRVVEDCDSIEALKQLKTEIGDGTVPVRWRNSSDAEGLPDTKYLRQAELLLVCTGFAPDIVERKYRALLVERSSLQEVWPLREQRREDADRRDSQSTDQQHRLRQPPASQAQIREALRRIYADPTNNRPNVNRAWVLLKTVLPTARKSLAHPIIREPEFANQRRNPGRQPKS